MKESQVFYVPPIPEVSVSPLYFNHCGRCMGIFHCEFNLHFPNGCWCWTSFHVLICHLYVVFCEVFLPAFASFLIGLFLTVEFWELFIYSWELSFIGYVVCTYFLPVCSLFFYSLYQVFSRAKVFSLDKNNFLYLITRYLWKNLSKIKLFLRIPRSLSLQFSSVAQSCLTLCDPMNRSTPGLPVHHQLPEFTQSHVHRVGDAIQPSHPLSSPSPAPNPSQHQGLFQRVSSSREAAKGLESQLQHPLLTPHKLSLHSDDGNRAVAYKFTNCFTSSKLLL